MKFARLVCVFAAAVAVAVLQIRVSKPADTPRENGFDTKLPGVADVEQLSDGAWVCSSMEAAYVSASDAKDWTIVPTGLPAGRWVVQCLGGSKNRMYFVASTERWGNSYAIYAVEPGREPANVRSLPPTAQPPAAFCSELIGAVSTGANLSVTADGGATWHPSPPLFETENARIMLIRRADASRLLVSDGRSLARYEILRDATLRQAWSVTPTDGVGADTQVPACDRSHVWLMGATNVTRLKLADGQADFAVPKNAVEANLRGVRNVIVVWDNAMIVLNASAQKVRALTLQADGAYAAGRWFPTGGFAAIPTAKQHCLLLGAQGLAYDFDLAADTLTPTPLHVVPPKPKPPQLSPESIKLGEELAQLERQLPVAEVIAIGEGITKRNDLTSEQKLELLKKEYQLAIDKHKANGTFNPPPKPLIVQIVDLGKQLPNSDAMRAAEARIWDEAGRKTRDPAKQQEFVRDQFEKLVATYKATGTLLKPGNAPATPGAAALNPVPESLFDQIARLGLQLPDGEARQAYADAAREFPKDTAKQSVWIKDRLEKLVAKHKADGTLRKPGGAVAADDASRRADADSLAAQILQLGSQLPEDEVKQVWDERATKTN